MSDNKPGNPRRANALEEAERTIVTYLRAQHLPGVDTDDEAGVALEIEQGRLLLFGAGGLILFISTQLLKINGAVCLWPLYFAIPLLLAALLGSWIGLTKGAAFRRARVRRRYTMYHAELDHYISALRENTPPDPDAMNAVWDSLIGPEDKTRHELYLFRRRNLWLASAGIACALWAAFATAQPDMCFGHTTTVGIIPPAQSDDPNLSEAKASFRPAK